MHFNSNYHFLCSSGSVYSLYADEDEEIEPSPSGQQIIENSITMNKTVVTYNDNGTIRLDF